jgi:hypothetical protein
MIPEATPATPDFAAGSSASTLEDAPRLSKAVPGEQQLANPLHIHAPLFDLVEAVWVGEAGGRRLFVGSLEHTYLLNVRNPTLSVMMKRGLHQAVGSGEVGRDDNQRRYRHHRLDALSCNLGSIRVVVRPVRLGRLSDRTIVSDKPSLRAEHHLPLAAYIPTRFAFHQRHSRRADTVVSTQSPYPSRGVIKFV